MGGCACARGQVITMGIEVELQRSLFARLQSVSGINGVYDTAPQAADGGSSAPFPYVTMGRAFFSRSDTWGNKGFSAQMRIHTFCRGGAMLECKTIQGRIYAALHEAEMSVPGFNNISLLREDSDCFADQDGKIHGVCEYRALIESA